MASRHRMRVAATIVLAVALALALPWMGRQRAVAPGLVKLERVPAPEVGNGFERWRMIGPGRDTTTGLWRAPPDAAHAPWTVVMLGGIGTDDRAATLVPDSLPVGVLAVSWPWKGPRRMSGGEFMIHLPAIRAALLRTPGALARGIEAVRRKCPDSRVAMLGASAGAPPTAAAVTLASVDALVLVDGSSDLGVLLRSEIARALGGGPFAVGVATVVAPYAAWLLRPLEPSRHAAAARDTPTLLVDAEHEDRLPRACVTALHAAYPHATVATHPGAHLTPRNPRQVSATIATVRRWLDEVPVKTVAAKRTGR